MNWPRLFARSLVLLLHAVWAGGFTFYGAVVIPILHEEYGALQGGLITQQVSDWLNLIGLASLSTWWALIWLERGRDGRGARLARLGLLFLSTLLLAFLAVDHAILTRRLELFGLSGFYGPHRVYLIASTVQWAANLALIPMSLYLWMKNSETLAQSHRQPSHYEP